MLTGAFQDGSADEEEEHPSRAIKAARAKAAASDVKRAAVLAKRAQVAAPAPAAAATDADASLELLKSDLLPAVSFSDLSAGMDVALTREAYPDTGVANAACVAWRSEVLRVVPGKGRSRNKIDVCGHLFMYPHKLIVGVAQLDDSGDEKDEGRRRGRLRPHFYFA